MFLGICLRTIMLQCQFHSQGRSCAIRLFCKAETGVVPQKCKLSHLLAFSSLFMFQKWRGGGSGGGVLLSQEKKLDIEIAEKKRFSFCAEYESCGSLDQSLIATRSCQGLPQAKLSDSSHFLSHVFHDSRLAC